MRLWHKDLISVLPKQQLCGQWRECCLIAKNIKEKGTPHHLLVNKIMDYPIDHFQMYSASVYFEMIWKGFNPNKECFSKWIPLFGDTPAPYYPDLFKDWHNGHYLLQCYYNLQEKHDCGGIPEDEWIKVYDYVMKKGCRS